MYQQQQPATGLNQINQLNKNFFKPRVVEIENRLRELGAGFYNMNLPETHTLPSIIHPDEKILGVVYGRYKITIVEQIGRGLLVATSKRVFLLDKKPLFLKLDEIIYRDISAISYSHIGPIGVVTLHMQEGDVSVRTFNQKCARGFVEAIERGIFKSKREDGSYDNSY